MTIYKISQDRLVAVAETSFATSGIYERRDIQQYLLKNIEVLGDDLLVVAEEFSGWLDSSRRIDLLCIDTKANLVVVEIKRTEDGGHMELQAIRYAAMISAMTFDHLVEVYADFHRSDRDAARAEILQFLKWNDVTEEAFAQDVRIILAAADFGKEVTTAVMWLRDHDIDIRCIRLKPYRLDDATLLLDVQQLIPLPEAANYQTQLGEKRRAERESRTDRHNARKQWWTSLAARPGTEAHAGVAPKASPYHYVRVNGLQWAYLVWQQECGVELFIDLGEVRSNDLFNHLISDREAIEARFGGVLNWVPVGEGKSAKVQFVLEGGYRTAESEWDAIQAEQVAAMQRLRSALEPTIEAWRATDTKGQE